MRFSEDVKTDIKCPACGSSVLRDAAKYCLDCGKLLMEDYQPLDLIRASYGLQGKTFVFNSVAAGGGGRLFEENKNSISQTAWACTVYSMVPYLGILFVPFALVIAGVGYAAARRVPEMGGRRLALISVGVSLLVLAVQILLWWLLYIIPELEQI